MAVAYNSVVGRIGLLETFVLTLLGTFFYEVNAQLHWRWYITDNGFNYRIILFGSILGLVIALLLNKNQTTFKHQHYQSVYKMMALALFGFLFMLVSLPILSALSVFTRTQPDNAVLYATNINVWLAIFSGVLGTFTSNAIFYRKFSLHDLVFTGLSVHVPLFRELLLWAVNSMSGTILVLLLLLVLLSDSCPPPMQQLWVGKSMAKEFFSLTLISTGFWFQEFLELLSQLLFKLVIILSMVIMDLIDCLVEALFNKVDGKF